MRILRNNGHLILSMDPVITAYMGTFQHEEGTREPGLPVNISADIIFEHMSWYDSFNTINTVKRKYDALGGEEVRMLVVNSPRAELYLKEIGLSGFCCNSEIYQKDYIYKFPSSSSGVEHSFKYGAIYNARLAAFKRHYLSDDVSRL